MNIGQEKDYTLSWEANGISFLVADVCMQGYNGTDVLDFSKDGAFFQYFLNKECPRYAQQGVDLYSSEKAFADFLEQLQTQEKDCENVVKKVLDTPPCSSTDVEALFTSWIRYARLYFCMGIEYLELAATMTDNPVIAAHLKTIETLKNPIRDYLAKCFLSEQSYLAQLVTLFEKRFGVPTEDLLEYTIQELVDLFEAKRVTSAILEDRRNTAIAQAHQGEFFYAWGDKARSIIEAFAPKEISYTDSIQGMVANRSPHPIRARVTLMKVDYKNFNATTAQMTAMPEGTILIAQTTAPELMMACRKAAAIVTDMGGLISHAAIVSRELGIPCIVGTKHATKIFKDGDMVEVDTHTGVVRKIS